MTINFESNRKGSPDAFIKCTISMIDKKTECIRLHACLLHIPLNYRLGSPFRVRYVISFKQYVRQSEDCFDLVWV